jgi:hypothetical protein
MTSARRPRSRRSSRSRSPSRAPSREIIVKWEREQIDITRSGILPPYKADPARVFIPGIATVYVTVDRVELPPMSPEQYAAMIAAAPYFAETEET